MGQNRFQVPFLGGNLPPAVVYFKGFFGRGQGGFDPLAILLQVRFGPENPIISLSLKKLGKTDKMLQNIEYDVKRFNFNDIP